MHSVNLYPYQPIQSPAIGYGFYGVQLFFIISGFVINQSLERSNSCGAFLKHRVIRLFPTMLLCSVITFLFVNLITLPQNFDFFESKTALDFLPSLTFTTPVFWNFLLDTSDIHYIDGVYWSLWAEIFFYLSAALIFFINRKNFLTTWLTMTTFLQLLRIVTSPKIMSFYPESLTNLVDTIYRGFFVFNLNCWVYFSIGVFMYALYSKRTTTTPEKVLMGFLLALEFYFLHSIVLGIIFIGFITLFVLLVYKPGSLKMLLAKPLLIIGLVSYPLYLLHQNVGVILISKFSVSAHPEVNIFIPLVVLLLFVLVSYIIYRYYEKPIIKFFR